MTTKAKKTTSADVNPQPVQIGKWKIPPITLHTAMLMEQIDSPFMRPPQAIDGSGEQMKNADGSPKVDRLGNPVIDPATIKYVNNVPTLTELARTLYVLINADHPNTDMIIDDPVKFRNAVSDLTRQMTLPEMATLTNSINTLMTRTQTAMTESGMDADGKKKETGRLP